MNSLRRATIVWLLRTGALVLIGFDVGHYVLTLNPSYLMMIGFSVAVLWLLNDALEQP